MMPMCSGFLLKDVCLAMFPTRLTCPKEIVREGLVRFRPSMSLSSRFLDRARPEGSPRSISLRLASFSARIEVAARGVEVADDSSGGSTTDAVRVHSIGTW